MRGAGTADVAGAAIAATMASGAAMILARVFRTLNAQFTGGFAADTAGEGECFVHFFSVFLYWLRSEPAPAGCLIIIPRQRCASWFNRWNSCSWAEARSEMIVRRRSRPLEFSATALLNSALSAPG